MTRTAVVFADLSEARSFVTLGMRLLGLPKETRPITPGRHAPPRTITRFFAIVQNPSTGAFALLLTPRTATLIQRFLSRLDAGDRARVVSALRDRAETLDPSWFTVDGEGSHLTFVNVSP